ncbi:MAG: hypothetical protein ABSF91_13675 [Bacteroidota bacterium]|jgi:hypothetical protein
MKPIWYFVGLLLSVLGVIVTISGLYGLANPPEQQKVLWNLHADIWWGAIMIVGGVIFVLANRKKTVR